ncbi:MAG: DUF3089 domain-containing protein [Leptospiraceae bacterium]
MLRRIIPILSILLLGQCTTLLLFWIEPSSDFQMESVPEAPDYSQREAWAALPEMEDDADNVPLNTDLKNSQSTARADVFFVHPTTYLSSDGWNAPYSASVNVYGLSPLKLQASVFNGSARVFAPRYRQATLYSFVDNTSNSRQAFSVAREDVLKAFQYYLKHHNNGRPFFLAGHSQGSMLLIDVLAEYLDSNKNPNFVAAYLPGWAVKPDRFKRLKPCMSATDTGCYISWNSKKWGSKPEDFAIPATRYTDGICINPISWAMDDRTVDPSSHLGAINFDFDRADRNMVSARCQGDMLWVKVPDEAGYGPKRGEKENYHVADYSLFYMDIRRNIEQRLQSFLR